MPLELSDAEMTLLTELAAPINQDLQQDFLRAVAVELEAHPSAIGEGEIHRVARRIQRQFWQPLQFGEGPLTLRRPRRQPKPTSGRGDNRGSPRYSDVIMRVAAETPAA